MGDAAALQAARQDHRFAAVVDLDGFPHGPASPALDRPALALTQEVTAGTDPRYLPRLTEALDVNTATSYRLTVPGAAHLAFMDGPLYLPPVPTIVGSLGRTRSPRVVAGPPSPSWTPCCGTGGTDGADRATRPTPCGPTANSAPTDRAAAADQHEIAAVRDELEGLAAEVFESFPVDCTMPSSVRLGGGWCRGPRSADSGMPT